MRYSFIIIFAAALSFAIPAQANQGKPLGETQLIDYFKWIKMDGTGLHFEERLGRGYTMKPSDTLTRRGPVWTLPFGGSFEMAWAHGALKVSPCGGASAPGFEAESSPGGYFAPGPTKTLYLLRLLSTPQGQMLTIEEEQ
jgi:hypothetical protein